jgi:prepilin-type N-terminal cleavage/methylation domain-containing protein
MRKGFTLVELSIVLVIIGLLIGGVLKGQAMIEGTKMKRFVSDIDSLVSATYSYQDRFNALPGDDINGLTLARGALADGNGNGQIGAAAEQLDFYRSLIFTGFIPGNAAAVTLQTISRATPFGSGYFVLSAAMGAPHTSAENAVRTINAIVPANVARDMDAKYDDGIFNTGDFQVDTDYPNTALKIVTWYKF